MQTNTITRTSVVIEATKISTYESDVAEFQIHYTNNSSSRNEVYLTKHINVIMINDFEYWGANNISLDNLIVGDVYYFRTVVVKHNGDVSVVTDWVNETIGDITNDMAIKPGLPNITSTGVTFNITVPLSSPNDIPEDFERFEWIIKSVSVALTQTIAPSSPVVPLANDAPTHITYGLDDIILTMTESRDKWYFGWMRCVDKSGNVNKYIVDSGNNPVTTGFINNWIPVGDGKISTVNPQTDSDDMPPDLTKCGILDMNNLANSINALA